VSVARSSSSRTTVSKSFSAFKAQCQCRKGAGSAATGGDARDVCAECVRVCHCICRLITSSFTTHRNTTTLLTEPRHVRRRPNHRTSQRARSWLCSCPFHSSRLTSEVTGPHPKQQKNKKPTTKNKTKIKGGSGLLRSRRHRRRRRSRCSCASPFTGPVRVSLRCRRVCGCCEGRVSGFVFFAFKSLARVSVGALFGGRSLSCSAVCFAWSLLILRQPLSMWGANRE